MFPTLTGPVCNPIPARRARRFLLPPIGSQFLKVMLDCKAAWQALEVTRRPSTSAIQKAMNGVAK